MPILFVNGKRRGLRIRGSARVNPASVTKRKPTKARADFLARVRKGGPAYAKRRARRIFAAAQRKRATKNPASVRARKLPSGWTWYSKPRKVGGRLIIAGPRRKKSVKRGRRARRSTSMARRKRRKGQPAALKRYWKARKRAGKAGRPGKTRRSSAARRRAALKGIRKARARAPGVAPKKRRKGRRSGARRTRVKRRRARRSSRSRRSRSRRTKRISRVGRSRRRTRRISVAVHPAFAKTVRVNPARRRRRKSRRGRRHARRGRGRRSSYRRYRRGYRRNPGNMLLDLAKRAVPLLLSFYGSKIVSARIAPMIPGLSSLGALAGPLTSVGVLYGAHVATKKVRFFANHKQEIMLGAAGAVVESLIQAFAPPSVKALVGMSDYIQMGDYVAVGAVQPIDDSMTLSDYIAVGGDGVEEELGLEEELGVEEELGNDLLGGVTSTSLMKRVPTQNFLAPVPARSFTKVIPPAGSSYDSPSSIYGGIFGGGFGR